MITDHTSTNMSTHDVNNKATKSPFKKKINRGSPLTYLPLPHRIIVADKRQVNTPRYARSAAPSPSIQASLEPGDRVDSFGPQSIFVNASRAHQRARSAAPCPSIQDSSEIADQSSCCIASMVPSNIHTFHQRARSNAPSPSPSISTNPTFKSETLTPAPVPHPGANPNANIKDKSASNSQPQQARHRSNAPSPSPPISAPFFKTENMDPSKHQPKPKPEPESERARRARHIKTPAPRYFRSSAPSPDRSLSMSCTPPAGVIPPANTPVDTLNNTSASSFTQATSSSSSSRAFLGRTSDSGGSDDGDEAVAVAEDEGEAGYNPENDLTLQDIYRQSMTSVTNTDSVFSPYLHTFPPEARQDQKIGVKEEKHEDENEKKGVWNPPHAPKAMQSHQITWINDRKVGERINGVQVPVDEDDEDGGKGGKRSKKGLSGKLKIGKKGGKKG
ncbi:hypothetical protein DL98DRAFT_636374 [Cadophora sp. DSE1049]|nr:hypothetical protein DL98DRAFT_636374 [Cadophora sp. DSE1049]